MLFYFEFVEQKFGLIDSQEAAFLLCYLGSLMSMQSKYNSIFLSPIEALS